MEKISGVNLDSIISSVANNITTTNIVNSSQNKDGENYFQSQLMMTMLKDMFADSPAYNVIMQSFTNALDGNSAFDFSKAFNNPNSLAISKILGSDTAASNKSTSTSGDFKIDEAIDKACKKYNMDPNFIKAVIKQESSYNPSAVSSAGAMGLMQLMPETAKDLGVKDSFNVEQNVDGGTKMLKDLLNTFGDQRMALAAYNAGIGTMKKRGVDDTSDLYKMPSETKDYITKVMNNYGK